jgi:hypothetical protein
MALIVLAEIWFASNGSTTGPVYISVYCGAHVPPVYSHAGSTKQWSMMRNSFPDDDAPSGTWPTLILQVCKEKITQM